VFALVTAVLLLLFALDVSRGSVAIPLTAVLDVFLRGGGSESQRTIILLFRLPRALTAVGAGAALSVAGLLMQTLFRNPLAGPAVLGVNAGSNLGVAASVLLLSAGAGTSFIAGITMQGRLIIIIAAVAGALLVMTIVMVAARYVGSVAMLLLFGLMFGYLANSLVSVMIHFSVASRIQSYLQWTFGSFAVTDLQELSIFLPLVAAGLLLAFLLEKPLNTLLLGEEYAASMGVSTGRIRIVLVALTSLFAGTVTAFCGPITFVGVAVPHLARGVLRTSDHRQLLPGTALLGASVALGADLVSRVPGSDVMLPLNAVTALIGAPVVVLVLLRSRRGKVLI
jgi:iron complex transport system permease protein